ncbi:MAG TPA: CopD family protein [Chitinophagales bacterium]|nr:CopD family protein [Chitinophagales bacterium]HMU68822.1 CopD family protein [Chitinophagales bacterium]HMX04144.1 CopD family protein [Chitinophagales bacterium]HMZ90407.1 CopD family protein [Chitinophagales bacterium]HNA57153.1 CopD family protein [Chitinophagales bacterium]
MQQYYPYFLAAHIIFVITWFAALFYIVRLYIYHTEALEKQEPERSILAAQFTIMEQRLMAIIGTPSMILVVITGVSLLSIQSQFLKEPWLHTKLLFVIGVIVYHLACLRIQKQLREGIAKNSSTKLRMFNEVATVLLVAIVFLVVLKDLVDMLYGLLGLIALSFSMLVAIRIYKRRREKR